MSLWHRVLTSSWKISSVDSRDLGSNLPPPPLAGEGEGGGSPHGTDSLQEPPPQPSPASGGGERKKRGYLSLPPDLTQLTASACHRGQGADRPQQGPRCRPYRTRALAVLRCATHRGTAAPPASP